MPVMNGIDATALIRQMGEFGKSVRIIGVTGNALTEDVAKFINAGCDEVYSLSIFRNNAHLPES